MSNGDDREGSILLHLRPSEMEDPADAVENGTFPCLAATNQQM
jgi:hypothetical protein